MKKSVNISKKKNSTSLAIQEMQIKVTLRLHLTPTTVSFIKHSKRWLGRGERGGALNADESVIWFSY